MENKIKNIIMNNYSILAEKENGEVVSRGSEKSFEKRTVCNVNDLLITKGFEFTFSSHLFSFAVSENRVFEIKDTYIYSFFDEFTVSLNKDGRKIVAGAANDSAFALLLDSGELFLEDVSNKLGFGKINEPTRIFEKVKKVQMNEKYLLILFEDSSIKLYKNKQVNPMIFPDLGKIKDISMSNSHILFLSEEDKLFFMGDDVSKEIRNPKEIDIPNGVKIKKIIAGNQKSFIITSDKEVYGRGRNQLGELGTGKIKVFEENFCHLMGFAGIEDIVSNHKYLTFFKTRMGKVYGCGDLILIGEEDLSRSPTLIDFK